MFDVRITFVVSFHSSGSSFSVRGRVSAHDQSQLYYRRETTHEPHQELLGTAET